ncbi:MAG: hypothetical protein AB203_01905 [Parcubacteria bacterium C7867-008]|nr:MAG: hypothetical protein AB203_01905 [Parcubacteria bacterium C7867-008]
MKKDKQNKVLDVSDPISLSARFLAARPDLVGAWIIGAHGLLPIFRTESRKAIEAFLETVQAEFFGALKHHWEKRNPGQKLTYTFGTICRNRRGDERLVTGIAPTAKGKPVYSYVDDLGKEGSCSEVSMRSWMDKQ